MSTPPGPEDRSLVGRLVRAVEHLAWPADRQRAYLADLGVAPLLDELALEFDDALMPVQPSFTELGISGTAQQALNSINLLLTELTAQAELDTSVWNSASLDTDSRWLDIRQRAQTVHAELVAAQGMPRG